MTEQLVIRTPSRLHFGLLSFAGEPEQSAFGGAGAMIGPPFIKASLRPHGDFQAAGEASERVHEFARRWAAFHELSSLPNVKLDVLEIPPAHVGLGTGTQLAMSIALLLSEHHGLPQQTSAELACSVGRGRRSAVGTHGFSSGGLIVERGKLGDSPIGELDCRLALPTEWCFALLRPEIPAGLSGDSEMSAFGRLPAVAPSATDELKELLRLRLVPAATTAQFDEFSEALYEYGHLAGKCFSTQQGGPYNGPVVTQLVQAIRRMGIAGVGQSSWGPTVFAVLPSPDAAREFTHEFLSQRPSDLPALQITLSEPDNEAAILTRVAQ